jgi:hypothetical protein
MPHTFKVKTSHALHCVTVHNKINISESICSNSLLDYRLKNAPFYKVIPGFSI